MRATPRVASSASGVVGVVALTAHFFVSPNILLDTATLAQLVAFATRFHNAILVSAWLQTAGALLIALFAVAIVHLAGAQARFSGWATLLTATIVAVLSLLDSAFIIAAVKASPTHPATRRSATTRSSARPTTRSDACSCSPFRCRCRSVTPPESATRPAPRRSRRLDPGRGRDR